MRGLGASVLVLCLAQLGFGQNVITVQVTGGKYDAVNVPVCVPLSLPAKIGGPCIVTAGVSKLDGHITQPSLVTESVKPAKDGLVRRDLHFILPSLKAGESVTARADLQIASAGPGFSWKQGKEMTELSFGDRKHRPILAYVHKPYDDSTPEARVVSYKVFHHLYDPSGSRIVTNGGHLDDPKVELKWYPHHRGLQYGFNKCSWDGGKKKADTWHCQKDDHQSHEGFLQEVAGGVLGRHRLAIDWHGPKKEVFVKEERELTVYNVPGGTLVEFASRLKPVAGEVMLDGDPQHAGFQFRAHNDVFMKTAKETYYLRPDGKGQPNDTRNWEPKTKKGPVNLPWNTLCFLLDGKRYSVCYLDHPSNPRESRHSERNYGRFGCYFEHKLTPERPLVVNYRIWLQEGEMKAEQVEALSRQFTAPPQVVVK